MNDRKPRLEIRRSRLRDRADHRLRSTSREVESPLFGLSLVAGLAAGAAARLLGGDWIRTVLAGMGGLLVCAALGHAHTLRRARRRIDRLAAEGRTESAQRLADRVRTRHGEDLSTHIAAARESGTREPVRVESISTARPPAVDEAPFAASPEVVAPIDLPPADPVLSTAGIAAMALLVPSLAPVIGGLAAIPLLVLSSLLLARAPRRPWDRRVGAAGLGVSLLAIVFTATAVAAMVPVSRESTGVVSFEPAEIPTFVWVLHGVVLLLSLVPHEFAHVVAARICGDSTAVDRGRLTLNPIRHLEPFGSVILPLALILTTGFVFGWARPVPVTPERFRNRRRGEAFVSSAGILANLLVAMAAAGALLVLAFAVTHLAADARVTTAWHSLARTTVTGIAAGPSVALLVDILKATVSVNCVLAFLNAMPVPPLDGFGLVESLAPSGIRRRLAGIRGIGLVVLLLLVFAGAIDVVMEIAAGAYMLLVAIALLALGG